MACILGGATSFRSRRELKLLTRDLCILQPCTGDVRLLRWSSMPLGFDSKDHPDRTAGVGVLPLVVSHTFWNLRTPRCWSMEELALTSSPPASSGACRSRIVN